MDNPETKEKADQAEDIGMPAKPADRQSDRGVDQHPRSELHARAAAADRGPERFRRFLMDTLGAVLGTVAGGGIIVMLSLMQGVHTVRLFD